ncbi:hypothetical protein QVH35_07155 [Candidatus Nitrosotenuis chungbukensis]|uniref:hypothetical protein n=1 Tax=Candidatus Nitrosotenuis chungbukensis TaxID=1353246 RepID=UPI002671A8BB|nr:hypothetical protein [Candidatus Nitrosotenuis chungbukensis]WKT57210.1 hypothetical protein QVH35_07155 [Candidatus Nitrosotenuis chungbukensis]
MCVKKTALSEEYINERISKMVKNGTISDDKTSLTEFGRTAIRVVLAGGVFDIIHPAPHPHTKCGKGARRCSCGRSGNR